MWFRSAFSKAFNPQLLEEYCTVSYLSVTPCWDVSIKPTFLWINKRTNMSETNRNHSTV